MGVREELDVLLANPECHAILVNALGDYEGMLHANGDGFADQYELAHIQRRLGYVDALRDVFERWP